MKNTQDLKRNNYCNFTTKMSIFIFEHPCRFQQGKAFQNSSISLKILLSKTKRRCFVEVNTTDNNQSLLLVPSVYNFSKLDRLRTRDHFDTIISLSCSVAGPIGIFVNLTWIRNILFSSAMFQTIVSCTEICASF